MSFIPWYTSDQKPVWSLGFDTDSGFLDITGLTTADFTLSFINMSSKTTTSGTGTFSNLVAGVGSTPPTIQYQPSLADVSNPGLFEVRVVLDPGTNKQRTFTFGVWECKN